MKLKEYQRKRSFDQTPEPKGGKAKPAKDLRFVVQMHSATRLHWDLRLEIDGVYKSWAVPKGPSLNPMDQRLAVQVEDHPIEYGTFEGVIPDGNYGAGTVVLWDAGTYLERGSTDRKQSEKAMRDGLAKGHITFLLEGVKLRGEFALIQLKKGNGKAWLLVKKRDAFSVSKIAKIPDTSVASGRSLEQVREYSLKKNITWLPKRGKAGKKAPPLKKPKRTASVSRPAPPPAASKTTLPRRLKPMLPAVAREVPEGKQWRFDAFGGGIRAIGESEDGRASLHSRQLLPLSAKYPEIVTALEGRSGLVVDGEIVGAGKQAEYRIIDLLYANSEDLRERPLRDRLKRLEALKLAKPLVVAKAEGAQPDGEWLARNLDSPYVSGTGNAWLRSGLSGATPKRVGKKAPVNDEPPLTHLDKIFFPKDKITKGNLIEYYRAVAPFILPHLKDRPQSMNRHPNGITKPSFYQKDVTGYVPKGIEMTRVYSPSAQRTINYLLCQNEKSLLYLINLGCIELNAWISKVPTLDAPDYCVIDLDPDTNSFDEVIEVAQAVHKALDRIGAPHGVKTSGASGIHIYIPVEPGLDFDATRAFAHAVCEKVHASFPKNTSLERNPAKRRGRIYLDFMQNRRGSTMAAPYCVRPRNGAPVSAPLHWKEVKKGLKPGAFTIHTMPARLKKLGDLWATLFDRRANLSRALKKL